MVPTTETVWEEFNTGLKHFILKHVHDEPSAEDILQDVFLKIHTHIGNLRESDKLQSWIFQIARNAITDFYRAHKFMPIFQEVAYIPEDPFDDVVSDLLPYVKKLVDNLPYDYRAGSSSDRVRRSYPKGTCRKTWHFHFWRQVKSSTCERKSQLMLLNCCHFQFDRLGRIIDYEPNCDCCVNQDCATGCK